MRERRATGPAPQGATGQTGVGAPASPGETAGGRASSPSRRDALRITAVAGIGAAFGGGLLLQLIREAGLRRVSETRTRMGTVVTLTVVGPDGDDARAWIAAAFGEMERLEVLLGRHRADGPVGRLNRTGDLPGAPPELLDVLTLAGEVAELSAGAFDVTVLPILRSWERAAEAGRGPPSDAEVDAARRLVDHRALRIDGEHVRLERPGMAITLDGIAKGYVVDRTIEVLLGRGADRVLVDAGGDMSTGGAGSAVEPWTVGIQDPHGEGLAGFVRLAGQSIATSGDYMNVFTDDRRAHHILDPRTGRSPAVASSVSVVASSAMRADALSTTVMVLGPEAGRDLLDRVPDAEGLIVTKDGTRVQSAGFDGVRG